MTAPRQESRDDRVAHGEEEEEERKTVKLPPEEKVNAILDLVGIIARTLLALFGKRKTDR